MTAPVSVRNLRFSWSDAPPLLAIDEFDIASGERVFLRGASGSGKSTLLGLMTGILAPQSGQMHVLGQDMATLSARKRDKLRATECGVIFQMFNLLPFLTVLQNVTLASRFSAERRARLDGSAETEARQLLARLGLTDEALVNRRVSALSVGQQQRVAVARALLGKPKLIFADEPTSALDQNARDQFLALLLEETERTGAALLMVSHDAALANAFDRALDLDEINKGAAMEAAL